MEVSVLAPPKHQHAEVRLGLEPGGPRSMIQVRRTCHLPRKRLPPTRLIKHNAAAIGARADEIPAMPPERLLKTLEVDRFVYFDHVVVVFTARLVFEPQSSAIRRLSAVLKDLRSGVKRRDGTVSRSAS